MFNSKEFRVTYLGTGRSAVVRVRYGLCDCAEGKKSSQHVRDDLLFELRQKLASKGIFIPQSATLDDLHIVRYPTLQDPISPHDIAQAKKRRSQRKRKFTI
ncbi:MAG: hypothetical protein Q4B06_03470 [Candidatus Saccharibacteria bacterium]|nr:hypothetical protein [Candidatus Saccharibacteria bacterium]